MDITPLYEKSFEASKIKKTIVIQIDDNENKSETTIIDPEINLILKALMNYYRKKKDVNHTETRAKHIKLHSTINEKMNKILSMNKNIVVNQNHEEKVLDKNKKDINNSGVEKIVEHKHRFLSQDINTSKNFDYKISNIHHQHYVDRKTFKNRIESGVLDTSTNEDPTFTTFK